MSEIRMEVEGLKEVQKAMTQAVKDLRGDPMRQGMAKATLLVQRDGRRNAPVDTGRLRSSITPEVVMQGQIVQGIVGSNVEYAPYQEFGTRRGVPARRYLQRALEANADKIFRLLGRVVVRIMGGEG
ncbi:MAG: HK97 gp10 family phage protein [Deltaproteobacteria bacterium]|nr:HK97 gp10 family phage protein [Deltaproteobacteria bacterium]